MRTPAPGPHPNTPPNVHELRRPDGPRSQTNRAMPALIIGPFDVARSGPRLQWPNPSEAFTQATGHQHG